jgi:hypothetical protein
MKAKILLRGIALVISNHNNKMKKMGLVQNKIFMKFRRGEKLKLSLMKRVMIQFITSKIKKRKKDCL